jgi:hypothetical protein
MEKEKLIKISENDWHYKLMKFALCIEPKDITSLCPYFWLTIASLFVFPFTAVFKLLAFICTVAMAWLDKLLIKLGDTMYESSFEKLVNNISDGELYYIANYYSDTKDIRAADKIDFGQRVFDMWSPKRGSLKEFLQAIIDKKGLSKSDIKSYKKEFKNEYDAYLVKVEQEKEEKQRKLEKMYDSKKVQKKRINNIVKFTKGLCQFIFALFQLFFVIVLTNALSDLFIYMFRVHVEWGDFFYRLGKVLFFMLSTIAAAICFAAFIVYSEKLHEKKNRVWYEDLAMYVYYPIRFTVIMLGEWFVVKFLYEFLFETVILGVFEGFVAGFKEFGGIFAEYFKASYNDYCPGITWKD